MTDAYGACTHKGCSPQVGQVGEVSGRRLIRIGGDAKRQSPMPGVVYLQQSPVFLSVWRHCCQIHRRSSRCLVVFSSVLENFVAVIKISSLLEISIADLLRGAWKGAV